MSTCENFKVKQKIYFYFKLVVFPCHKVVENGLKREVIYPITSLVGESALLKSLKTGCYIRSGRGPGDIKKIL